MILRLAMTQRGNILQIQNRDRSYFTNTMSGRTTEANLRTYWGCGQDCIRTAAIRACQMKKIVLFGFK